MTNIPYEDHIRAANLQRSAAIGALIAAVVVALWHGVRTRLQPPSGLETGHGTNVTPASRRTLHRVIRPVHIH